MRSGTGRSAPASPTPPAWRTRAAATATTSCSCDDRAFRTAPAWQGTPQMRHHRGGTRGKETRGMTVISKALLDDHDRLKRLFVAFNRSPSPRTAMHLIEEMKVHSTIEEELVYPVIPEQDPNMADSAEADHADVADL